MFKRIEHISTCYTGRNLWEHFSFLGPIRLTVGLEPSGTATNRSWTLHLLLNPDYLPKGNPNKVNVQKEAQQDHFPTWHLVHLKAIPAEFAVTGYNSLFQIFQLGFKRNFKFFYNSVESAKVTQINIMWFILWLFQSILCSTFILFVDCWLIWSITPVLVESQDNVVFSSRALNFNMQCWPFCLVALS